MSSVYGLLSHSTTYVVDDVVQSAEDEFHGVKADADSAPDFYEMLTFIGGSLTQLDSGEFELLLAPRTARKMRPWHARTIYGALDDVPQKFCDDMAALYWRMRDNVSEQKGVRKCRNCQDAPATHSLLGVPFTICEGCVERLRPIDDTFKKVVIAACVRCGADVHNSVAKQVKEVGKFTGLCDGCYHSRAVSIWPDGTVSW